MSQENELLEHTAQVISILANPNGGSIVSPNPGSPMGFTIIEATKEEAEAMKVSKTSRNHAIKQALDIYAGLYDRNLEQDKAHFQVFKALTDGFTEPDDRCAVAEWILGVDPAPSLLLEDLPTGQNADYSKKDQFLGDYRHEFFHMSKDVLLNDAVAYSSPTGASAILAKGILRVAEKGGDFMRSHDEAKNLHDTLVGKWHESYERHGKTFEMVETALMHHKYDADDHRAGSRLYYRGRRSFGHEVGELWEEHVDRMEGEEKRGALNRALENKYDGLYHPANERLEALNHVSAKAERTALMQKLLGNMARPEGGGQPGLRPDVTG